MVPKTIKELANDLLNDALDVGIREQDFWFMTFGEVYRQINSFNRVFKQQQQNQAYMDYTLAALIGHSVARIHSKTATMPQMETVYSHLFDAEKIQEQKRQKQIEMSALRFKQFANSFNSRY